MKPGQGSGPSPGFQLSAQLAALIPQLVKQLQPYFLPASYAQPPGNTGLTGNRTVTVNNQQPEAQLVKLTNGLATISYQNEYAAAPVIQITVVNPTGNTSTNTVHLYGCASTQGCLLRSTSNADQRQCHVTIFTQTSAKTGPQNQ